MDEKNSEPKKVGGVMGFLIRLRESGAGAALPGKVFKVVIMLYSHRNVKGTAFPSEETLAKEAGVSINTVKRAVRWMKACLGVRVTRKNVNDYYLPLTEKVDPYQTYSKKRPGRMGQLLAPKEVNERKGVQ